MAVSSNYQLLCMSHDPAFPFGEEWSTREPAEIAARTVRGDGHDQCDVLIGRFSYPLIEVGCAAGPTCTHRSGDVTWIGQEWLWLLAAACSSPLDYDVLRTVLEHVQRKNLCWTDQRVQRLRVMLVRD